MWFWIIGGIILLLIYINDYQVSQKQKNEQQEIDMVREMGASPTYTEKSATQKASSQKKSPKPELQEKRHMIAGTYYYMDAIMRFAHENPKFAMKKRDIIKAKMENTPIYKYTFDPVVAKLEPEPDNPHDPKAIKVLFNGVHIGYIKKGSCAHIHKLMKENRIVSISGKLYGGPCKQVTRYSDDPADTEYEQTDNSISAEVRIVEKAK